MARFSSVEPLALKRGAVATFRIHFSFLFLCFTLATVWPAWRSSTATLPAATLPAATLPAATLPAATLPAATLPAATLPAATLPAATLPGGFTEALVASELSSPTAMAVAPDGRVFVCQQGGNLRVVKNGALLPTPFVTLSVNSSGERGLLGVAFDPNFASNQFVYVYYTTSSAPIHNRVSRFTANGDVAVAGSEAVLLELDNLTGATNHNGGAMHFGPDGKLYIATGENATPSNSQSLNNLLGKILRINADGSIPTDNPFFNQTTGNNRAIWALGLRNPFTFNFQPGTGRMFINDVGQVTWEEVNDGIAGSNYGWPNCEGPCSPPNANFRDPIHWYPNSGSTCAITGGAFYNPASPQFPAQYIGKYFFADYCAGWIQLLDPATNGVTGFATGLSFAVDLQVSADGALYYLQRGGGGQLWRVEFSGQQAPIITQHPSNQTVSVGQSATFTVAASGAAPLAYQWRRNGANIPGANATSYTVSSAALADNGARFSCFVSNSAGNATSNEAMLTVVTNQPPVATITAPAAGALYRGGEVINYSGTGADSEQGSLPPSAFTWEVVFHHDTHTHPFIPPFGNVTGGQFTIPVTGETAANVWYRIHLTVTDTQGAAHSVFRDIFPRTVTLTLAANPSGLQMTLDGQPVVTPSSIAGVVGIQRTLGVISPQNFSGQVYQFTSWSDGGAATHTISTPAANTTYTATFTSTGPTARATRSDFDGDGRTDLSVWRGANANWMVLPSSGGLVQTTPWGASSDSIVPGDFDGDGKTDIAYWRPSNGTWNIIRSSNGQTQSTPWGAGFSPHNDVPVPGDYDGDRKTDLAVWRRASGTWFILKSSNGQFQATDWGAANAPYNDTPAQADYDGDGKTDIAVWRQSDGNWYVLKSSNGQFQVTNWGLGIAPYNDRAVPADYDGDGKADIAVWRPLDGNWYIVKSSTGGFQVTNWGLGSAPYNDVPVPGDYDGDGKADIAVWRPSDGTWYVIRGSNGSYLIQTHGQNGDTPVPSKLQ